MQLPVGALVYRTGICHLSSAQLDISFINLYKPSTSKSIYVQGK
jgi:hypothetical protein